MNRKLDEKLAQLAFGELTETQAAELQAQAARDPQLAKELDAYRFMREGLRDMRDVPADQLSRERLREAILNRGAAPSRAARPWGWVWMPVTALMLAFAFTMVRQSGPEAGKAPVVVSKSPAERGNEALGLNAPNIENLGGATSPSVEVVEPEETPSEDTKPAVESNRSQTASTVADSRPVPRTRGSERRGTRPSVVAIREEEKAVALGGLSVPDVESAPAPAADMALRGMTMPKEDESGEPAIVLITSEEDLETGAQRAIEVQNASNVIVGG